MPVGSPAGDGDAALKKTNKQTKTSIYLLVRGEMVLKPGPKLGRTRRGLSSGKTLGPGKELNMLCYLQRVDGGTATDDTQTDRQHKRTERYLSQL